LGGRKQKKPRHSGRMLLDGLPALFPNFFSQRRRAGNQHDL